MAWLVIQFYFILFIWEKRSLLLYAKSATNIVHSCVIYMKNSAKFLAGGLIVTSFSLILVPFKAVASWKQAIEDTSVFFFFFFFFLQGKSLEGTYNNAQISFQKSCHTGQHLGILMNI